MSALATHDVPRDRWGRYLIVPPDGGPRVPYTRATTVAKTLDDTTSLMKWGKRMVVIGLATRPDLVDLARATPVDDRRRLDDIAERAADAGGATTRRDLGTAVHDIVHRSIIDPTFTPPPAHAADVDAVREALATHHLDPVPELCERVLVHDRHRIAGKPDMLCRLAGSDRLVVVDLKTGSSVEYGALGWATQLAAYATADAVYTFGAAEDGSGDRRDPLPPRDAEIGVILHLEPGSGRCDVHDLRLTVGVEALELAVQVRKLRPIKPLSPRQVPAGPAVCSAERFAHLEERVRRIIDAGHGGRLARIWPDGVPTLKRVRAGDTLLDADAGRIASACAAIEADTGMPFPDTADPGGELAPVTEDELDELGARSLALPPDLRIDVPARATRAEMVVLTEAVVAAEKEAVDRQVMLDPHLAELAEIGGDGRAAAVVASAGRTADVAQLTATEAALVPMVCEAAVTGFLTPDLTVPETCGHALVLVHGSKKAALDATRRACKRLGIDRPRSFAELLERPPLVAVAVDPTTLSDQETHP